MNREPNGWPPWLPALPGSWPATAFVAWYNGHPDFQECEFDLSCRRAVVIGNGNVAVDVARMLALAEEELAPTDTTDPAIAAILGSPIEEIVMLGRRGPAEASFTTPELKELGEIAAAVSKGKSKDELAEEHADLLILLLGNCIALDLDIETAFHKKCAKVLSRPVRRLPDGKIRVTEYQPSAAPTPETNGEET